MNAKRRKPGACDPEAPTRGDAKERKPGTRGNPLGFALGCAACAAVILLGVSLLWEPQVREERADQVSEMLREAVKQNEQTVFVVDADPRADADDALSGTMMRLATGDDASEQDQAARAYWEGYDPAPEVKLPVGENQIKLKLLGRIRIDRLQIHEPVVEGCAPAALRYAIGHLPGSAAPGETGQCVLAGHRQYRYGKQFNRLGEIRMGDVICFDAADGQSAYYCVDEIYLVAPEQQGKIERDTQSDAPRVTLITCHPVFVASSRLIVKATRFDPEQVKSGREAMPPPRPLPDFPTEPLTNAR